MSKPLRSFNRLPNGQFAPRSAYAYVKTYDSGHKRYYVAGERVTHRAFEKTNVAYIKPSIVDREAVARLEKAIIPYSTSGAQGAGHVKDVGSFTYDEPLTYEEAKLFVGSELGIDPERVYITAMEWIDGEYYVDAIADFSDAYSDEEE